MEDKDNKPVSLRNDFSYREIETFGQMMLWLPNIADDQAAMDMSTADVVRQLVRVASEFEAEWEKITDEEHEQLGEDWLVEVEKLARWVKAHLDDVLHNDLEYGLYRAGRPKFLMVVEELWDGVLDFHRDEVTTSEKKEMFARDASRAWEEMLNQAFIYSAINAIKSQSGSSETVWRDAKVLEVTERDNRGVIVGHRRYGLEMNKEELG